LAVHLLVKAMWKTRDCLGATFRFYERMCQVE
jgi:hypothetical protein